MVIKTKQSLRDIEIDEDRLEWIFTSIGTDTHPILGANIIDLKEMAIEQGRDKGLFKADNIADIRYNITGSKARVYVTFDPSNKQEVKIKEYRRIFDDNCSLVLCEANGKEFIYFDPISKSSDYETSLGEYRKIKLGAIATGDTHNMVGKEFSENIVVGTKEEFLRNGFVQHHFNSIPLYQTVFENLKEEKKDREISIFKVKSPINEKSNLELIADTSGFDSRCSNKKIVTNFYFVGML